MQKTALPTRAAITFIVSLAASAAFAAPLAPTPPSAQPNAAPAPPTASVQGGFGGPVIPGVCLLSREAVFAQSTVGQAATARLKQLGERAQAGLEAERRTLESEARALQTQQLTLTAPQVQHRQQQLQSRAQALQAKAAQISRELEATRAKATGRIEDAVQPVVVSAYQAKGCGLLLSRDAVLGGNLANDLTAAVIQGLNARMSTITFEREHLPPEPAVRSR